MVKFSTLLTILFIGVGVISIFAVGYITYINYEKILTQQVYDHLATAAQSRANHIRTYLSDQKLNVKSLADSSVVFRDLLVLDKTNPLYAERLDKTKQRLISAVNSDPNFYSNFLLDKNGKVLASSDVNDEGVDKSNDTLFIESKKGVYLKDVYLSPTNRLTIGISAPVLDTNSNLLGVYVTRIDLNKIAEITADRTGLGETGEIFLINNESYMITPSKYLADSILKIKVDTINSRACINEMTEYEKTQNLNLLISTETLPVFKDYRGINVLGSHAQIVPEATWCLIAKLDESEALGIQRNQILINILYILLGLTLLISIFAYLFSKLITKPLGQLTANIGEITKGNLEIQLKKSRISEVQGLTDSLNRILASLKLAILRSGTSKEELGLGEAIKAKEEAEKETQLQKFFLEKVINTIADPIFVKDRKHNWILLNDAFCKFMGHKREELLGKSDYEFFPKSQADVFWEKDEFVFKNKKENINEEKLTDSKGVIHTIITKKNIYINPSGEEFLVGIIRDISGEREAEEKIKKNEELFNEAGKMAKIGGWEIDIATMKETWTDEVYKIHEVDKSYIPNVKKGLNFYSKNSKPIIEKAVKEAINHGKSFDLELELITAKRNHKKVRAMGSVFKENGKVTKVYGTFQEIKK